MLWSFGAESQSAELPRQGVFYRGWISCHNAVCAEFPTNPVGLTGKCAADVPHPSKIWQRKAHGHTNRCHEEAWLWMRLCLAAQQFRVWALSKSGAGLGALCPRDKRQAWVLIRVWVGNFFGLRQLSHVPVFSNCIFETLEGAREPYVKHIYFKDFNLIKFMICFLIFFK